MCLSSSVKLVGLSTFRDERGSLFVIENNQSTFPFEIKRTYLIYDVPSQKVRAGHAHRQLNQLMLAASGSFTISVNDGTEKQEFLLDSPTTGLLISPGIWRDLYEFSAGATCLVFADKHYDRNDYIDDFDKFREWRSQNK